MTIGPGCRQHRWRVLVALGSLLVVAERGHSWPAFVRAITPASFGRIDDFAAVLDFNGDGAQDLLVGGNRALSNGCSRSEDRPLPPPLRVMLSMRDGTFRDGTAEVVERNPASFFNPAWPVSAIGDFNGDGRPDIAIFDVGTECGTYPNHSYIGYPPILLVSGADRRWRVSDALATAVATFHAARQPQFAGSNVRVLSASAGDIDGDGDVDLWVESCGGQNLCSHFLMNDGNGAFTVDESRARSEVLHNPRPEFWRHWASALADLNNDGRPDLVLGQIRDHGPTHVNQASLLIFNDGNGRFPLANRVLLPQPDFAGGFTSVRALTALLDLDGDGRKDLVLSHARHSEDGGTGRYLQVLLNRGDVFVDDSVVRFGDQSATTARESLVYRRDLRNSVTNILISDVDSNGAPDLVLNAQVPIGRDAPLVHLNEGNGVFIVPDTNVFTNGELFFGENSVVIDLNGDGIQDFVHLDALPGPDRTYGTPDDATQLIALVARGTRPD